MKKIQTNQNFEKTLNVVIVCFNIQLQVQFSIVTLIIYLLSRDVINALGLFQTTTTTIHEFYFFVLFGMFH